MRILVVTAAFALAGTLAVDLESSAAPAPPQADLLPPSLRAEPKPRSETVDVAFVRDGTLVRVERPLPKGAQPALHALRELAEGPTRAEREKGLRTAIRPGLKPRFVRPAGGVLLVRLSRTLLAPATPETMRARLAQIAATLTWLDRAERHAAISAEGRLVSTLRLGVRVAAEPLRQGEGGYAYSVRGVQARLWSIGFLDRADVSGSLDYATEQALLAFQGWEGLARTGTVTGETQVALFRASAPKPATRRPGRRVEIHRERGVLLTVEGGEVLRAVHTSTGAGGATPAGEYRVYRKELLSWSVPFEVWMPYASYFLGGIAMHEYSIVPSYPASHGCVRMPARDAERVYRFVELGTPVHVF
ncbi:MAG TPA: L,D-transpeptidase family protein [Gaiellaceae bacterium]|nr:L,D-transpeptidase family protein [Gaiellaceae bacterium]